MAVPLKYRKSPEVSVNYDFADLLANVGYVTLYGLGNEAGAKLLVRQAIDSAGSNYESSVTGTTGNVESNFDYQFLNTQLVKGDLYVTITIACQGSGATSATNDTTVEIFHYDGTTETTIGTQQAIAQLSAPDGTQVWYRTSLKFAVDRKFKKGDKLRIEVISTVTSSNANSKAKHMHDGANRDWGQEYPVGTTTDSNLIVLVPFDLNL